MGGGAQPCGRTYPRLPNGIFGRIDDAFTIRGENVYPNEIDAALNTMADYGGEHRIVISRERTMDELLVQVEPTRAVYGAGREAMRGFRDQTAGLLQRIMGIRVRVEALPPDSLPRTDFKARRVVDDRDVFRELNRKLEKER